MNFKKGDYFELENERVDILDCLGEGGQGEVYKVCYLGEILAFKYYKDKPSDDFRYNLKTNIEKGAPSDSYLWPKEIVEFDDDTCGYLMNLRPKNYVSFISYLTGHNKFKNKRILLNWCIELVKNFKLLHERGYSYQDINDGSFFLDPNTGKILICDNDNVTADKRNLGVLGKMRYMAPEIVRGDKNKLTKDRQMPDVHSDRFSLAIILFLALCLGNPFEGEHLKNYAIIDEKAEYELFGSKPTYVYSELDKSNRPIHGYHTAVLKRYPLLPSYIKAAFHRTFVDGLKDRENGRTTELEWLRLLTRFRDELITCSCGEEYIYGFSEKKKNNRCPSCNNKTRRFTYLQVGKNLILLEPEKYLYEFHINKYSSNYNLPVAKVIVNKSNPSLWGIKLKLESDVLIKDRSGREKSISKDGVIPIIDGLKIKFNEQCIGSITAI